MMFLCIESQLQAEYRPIFGLLIFAAGIKTAVTNILRIAANGNKRQADKGKDSF